MNTEFPSNHKIGTQNDYLLSPVGRWIFDWLFIVKLLIFLFFIEHSVGEITMINNICLSNDLNYSSNKNYSIRNVQKNKMEIQL